MSDPLTLILIGLLTVPVSMLAYAGVSAAWDRIAYAAYLWRHRRFLKF